MRAQVLEPAPPGEPGYSYELMRIFAGAAHERDLQATYDRCLAALPYEIDPIEASSDPTAGAEPSISR